jgi:hypothetical protein
MKDLIEKLLTLVPHYLLSLGRLMAMPKTFLGEIKSETDEAFRDALQFSAISSIIVLIALSRASPSRGDIWARAASVCILELIGVSGYACILWLAWRIAAGRFKVRQFFTLYSYMVSVALILFTITLLVSLGTEKTLSPVLYGAVQQARSANKVLSYQLVSQILTFSTKLQSLAALAVTHVFTWPLVLFLAVLGRAVAVF